MEIVEAVGWWWSKCDDNGGQNERTCTRSGEHKRMEMSARGSDDAGLKVRDRGVGGGAAHVVGVGK
jgi:hypothetical protein